MAPPSASSSVAAPGISPERLKIFEIALGGQSPIIPASAATSSRAIEKALADAGRAEDAKRARLADVLADAVGDDVDLAVKILKDNSIKSTRDLAANYGPQRVASLAAADDLRPEAGPSGSHQPVLASGTRSDRAKIPSLRFQRRLFAAEPTAVLQHMIASNDERVNPSEQLPIHASAAVRTEVATFLGRQPADFNIRTTSILTAIHRDKMNLQNLDLETRATTIDSLKLLQRVQALAPVPEAVRPLLDAGMTTAMRVSSMPKKRFIDKMAPALADAGVPSAEADVVAGQMHDHAMESRLRADHALVQIHQAVEGSGLKHVDGPTTLAQRKATFNDVAAKATGSPSVIDLHSLFDDMDMCQCDSCLDVTSPTAYFVDLLQYLRNNDLDDDPALNQGNTGNTGWAGTALEKLFHRRPDLQHLQLTCANANTVLPMIDLANEVMEAFAIHAGDYASSGNAVIETWNIDIETTAELLASPSYTRKKAYCILKEWVYPLASLPYFQPLDATRLYLQYLGTSRFELIDTFRLAQRQWVVDPALVATPDRAALYAKLLGQVQDRAAAAEGLGLTPDDYVIIARESLWPITCSVFADDGTPITQTQYLQDIGVLDPQVYWGYKTSDDLLGLDPAVKTGLTWVKAQFLARSGLTFAETADLCRTSYVNPMMPVGQDRVMLDAIRFSYRFLQHFTLGITDKTQRNQVLSTFLFQTQAWAQKIFAEQVPPTGNDLVKSKFTLPTFTQSDISAWIAKWFDCVGQLTVLESGEGPKLPVQGYLIWIPPIQKTLTMGTMTSAGSSSSQLAAVSGTAAKQATTTILGYLDDNGEIRDSTNTLVGFVGMNSKVYYGSLTPIRKTYQAGTLFLYQIAKQDVLPTVDTVTNVPAVLMTVQIDEESILESIKLKRLWRVIKWSSPVDTCSIDNAKLIHLNGTPLEISEWDRINRFIRLYKKLLAFGWTISQIDSALIGLGKVPELPPDPLQLATNPPSGKALAFSFSHFKDPGCGCDSDGGDGTSGTSPCDPSNYVVISPGFLKEMMTVQQLAGLTGLDLDHLLCLWNDIGAYGGSTSLYGRLFLTHELEAIDTVFLPDDDGNYLTSQPKIGDHTSVIIAALRLNAKIFSTVLQRVGLTADSIITIHNLTLLYRHVLLAGILGIQPKGLLNVLDLFPNPYASASATLDLYRLWTKLADTSFTVMQLRYIILNLDDPLNPIGPSLVLILRTTKAVMDSLAAIDAANPDLTAQEQGVLTAAQVQAKATLMFNPSIVSDITGLIEGTRVLSTNAPVGLVVPPAKISPKLVYNDPLTPPNRRATLGVTGCLTDNERNTALALFPGNDGWSSALARLQKQAANLVKNELGAIFAADIDGAIAALTVGDVPATPPPTSSDAGDPGTAPAKRVYFMTAFLPYLRKYLYTQSIPSIMSGTASISSDICGWLLSNVITVGGSGGGDSQTSAMDVLIALKSQAQSGTSPPPPWTGYLIPPSSATYVFYGYGDTRPPALILGGVSVPFGTQNEDPSNLWWTAPVSLVGGQMISLQVSGQTVPGDLQWKTDRTGITAVPAGVLVSDQSVGNATGIFAPFMKAAAVISGFSLSLAEAQYMQTNGINFSGLTFNAVTLSAWKRLLAYFELRMALPSREDTLIDLFKWADAQSSSTGTAASISQMVSAVTTWDQPTIQTLLDPQNLNLVDPKAFNNEVAMAKLNTIFSWITKVGIKDVSLVLSWIDLKLDFSATWALAKSIRQTIRGKYSASDYEQAIKPTHDQLRKNQRDALIAYLLVQPPLQQWGVSDADGLFEFFLLDVQMGSCMQTSRTKQAISSVQLFVKRCMLGLEQQHGGIANDALDATRWEWMSKQTVWTANRKVFLYPENWLVPSLRDDKTPLYTDMESELLQHDVQPSSILDSFRNYVTGLGEIAHLRAVGVYVDEKDTDHYVFHCVAMTVGSPYLFFYRRYDHHAGEWTPWIRITVDIPTYSVEFSTVTPPKLAADPTPSPSLKQQVGSVTGCYLIPIIWESRTLLFIGQITKTTNANSGALTSPFSDYNNPSSTTTAQDIAPTDIWQINVAWTEYRAGKWTQKRVSSEALQTEGAVTGGLPAVDTFQFMPQIVTKASDSSQYVSIEVWHIDSTSGLQFDGNFVFNGTMIQQGSLGGQTQPIGWTATSFHLVGGQTSSFIASSLQKSPDGTSVPFLSKVPYVNYSSNDPNGLVTYLDNSTDLLYHPFSASLISAATQANDTSGISPIEAEYMAASLGTNNIDPAFGTVVNTSGVTTFSELSKPYTNYNWELGFHGPMEVATALTNSLQFDAALEMIHHVFNPYADGDDETRVWQWYPFANTSSDRVLEGVLDSLKPRTYDLNISQWRDHPFDPWLVARSRIVAYMKWTVMSYIQTLIAYGDMYFRRATLEDIPLAVQMYVLASHLYGPAGETIPPQGTKIPQTYHSLADKWDAFSNAVVQLEIAFPYSNQTPFPWGVVGDAGPDPTDNNVSDSDASNSGPDAKQKKKKLKQQIALADLFGFATQGYFCLPSNPTLLALRQTIDQRLYNIRNCLDIDGRPLVLPLWDAPIDPGQLVAAIASGLSLSSALNDLNASLPNYRFTWLLGRALDATSELRSLESAFLTIKEKRDSEALQLLRSDHEIKMTQMVMDVKKSQLEEAKNGLAVLQAGQLSSVQRFDYYSRLAGVQVQALGSTPGKPFTPVAISINAPSSGDSHINSIESQSEDMSVEAQFWNDDAANSEIVAGIMHMLPNFNIHMTPFGCGVEVTWGTANIAAAAQASARQSTAYASDSNFNSGQASRKANYIKQFQDRVHQMNLAGLEYEHFNTQITAQQSRIKTATLDIAQQQQLIDNAQAVNDFLRNKYTNDELYRYLQTTTRTALYQNYLLAYDLARKAELAYRFERRPSPAEQATPFVSFGYFNQAWDGLQASQQLYLALKTMDTAYQNSRGHDYEIAKSISLRQLDPLALLTLRETGTCTFSIPEVLFDMDFPGHYFRRIKTVSVTIPCVVGPFAGVNATLRLLSHKYRANPKATSARDYAEDTSGGALDPRFLTVAVPVDAVATSSAQNDSGAFELSLKDDRYVPFEGAGAVATWQLVLPPLSFRPFDYTSIADVVLAVRYTACEGGAQLRAAAAASVRSWVATAEDDGSGGLLALWDLRAEFAAEWAKLAAPPPAAGSGGDDVRTLVLRGLLARLPAFVAGRDPAKVLATDVTAVTSLALTDASDLAVDFKYTGGAGSAAAPFDSGPLKVGPLNMFRLSQASAAIGDWALQVKIGPGVVVDASSRLWMVVRYVLSS